MKLDLIDLSLAEIGRLSPRQVRHIFQRVALLERGLGQVAGDETKWLIHFAWTVTKADEDNFTILHPAACMVIVKYKLLDQLP